MSEIAMKTYANLKKNTFLHGTAIDIFITHYIKS